MSRGGAGRGLLGSPASSASLAVSRTGSGLVLPAALPLAKSGLWPDGEGATEQNPAGAGPCRPPIPRGAPRLPRPPSLTSLALLPSCSSVDAELTSLCQSVLEDFNLCLFYLPSSPNLSLASEDGEESESGCAFLPDLLIFQMVVICLMGVHSLQRAGASPGSLPCPPASGTLAALSHSGCFVNPLPQAAPAGLGKGRGCRSGAPGSGRRQPRVPSHEHTAVARTQADRVRCTNLPGRGERGAGSSREDTGRAGVRVLGSRGGPCVGIAAGVGGTWRAHAA